MINLWKIGAAVVAAGAALTVAVSASAAPVQVKPAPHLTAVELANGLLFRQGPAATYLTKLNASPIAIRGNAAALERSVDHQLRANHSLSARFAAGIQSGNRVRVQSALSDLSPVVYTAANQVFGKQQTARAIQQAQAAAGKTASKAQTGETPDDINFAVKDNYVDAYTVGVVIVAVFSLGVLIDIFAPNAPSHTSRLSGDQVVNVIATGLRTS